MTCFCTSTKRTDHCQLKVNLIVVSLLQLPLAIIFSTPLSSLYLFVTSSTTSDSQSYCSSSNSTNTEYANWHGLNESDSFYSLVVTARGIGLLLAAFIAIWLPFLFQFRVSMLLAMLFPLTSSLLYSNTTEGWMIMLAYILQGISFGLIEVLLIGYLSVTATYVEQDTATKKEVSGEKESNNKRKTAIFSLKDKHLAATLLYRTIGWPIGLGISSVMTQFEKTVDQFRWPGWANSAVILLFAIIFLTVYREVETGKKKAPGKVCSIVPEHSISTAVIKTYCNKVKFPRCRTIMVYSYLAYAGFVMASLIMVNDTLVPPILSDHYGFSLTYISYVTLGIMLVSFVAGIALVLLKILRVNNRKLFFVILLVTLIGGILASDWQAIGVDPCEVNFKLSLNTSTLGSLTSAQGNYSLTDVSTQSEGCIENSNFSDVIDTCLAGSTDVYECYWNQDSTLTGIYCELCRRVCRSASMTIHIVRFCLGALVMNLSALMGWTTVVGIATDCTSKKAQSAIVGILFVMAGLAWLITPLWCIWVYDFVGKRTFGPMMVWNTTVLLTLVGLIGLYKQLAPLECHNNLSVDKKLESKELHTVTTAVQLP